MLATLMVLYLIIGIIMVAVTMVSDIRDSMYEFDLLFIFALWPVLVYRMIRGEI